MRIWFFAIVALIAAMSSEPRPLFSKGAPGEKKTEAEPGGVPDQKRIQGEWQAVAGEKRGKKVDNDEVKTLIFHFDGDKINVTDKNRKEPAVDYKLDSTKNPKEIDIILSMPNFSKSIPGIYKFDGDQLTIRFSEVARPKQIDGDLAMDEVRIVLIKKAK